MKALNQRGFHQVFLVALACVVIVGVIGTYYLVMSRAASPNSGAITSGYSGKCLDDLHDGTKAKSSVDIYTCNSTVSQQWQILSNNTIKINKDDCLGVNVPTGTTSVANPLVQLYYCRTTTASLASSYQQWKVNGTTLVNIHSGKCMAAISSNSVVPANGTLIHLAPCSASSTGQIWHLPKSTTTTSSCGPSGQCVPVGNISGWNQVFETNFPNTVPLGAFSNCGNGDTTADTYCTGLESYGSYYNDWWAYPSGWPDTSEECIEGSSKCPNPGLNIPIGGEYEPQNVVSVSGNEMHINMYRSSSGGDNQVATVVPRQCMNLTYGRYTERFEVTQASPGFKSAHLLINNASEIDYPENDYSEDMYAYTHPGGASFSTNTLWTSGWHTTVIQWSTNSLSFYLDGKLIGTTSTDIPNAPVDWIIQNESSILGPYSSPGATSKMNIAWVACYVQS